MNGPEIFEFDDAALSRFRRRLLRTKGSFEQRDFLSAICNDGSFLQVLNDNVSSQGSHEPELSPEPLTESEFKQPPVNTEEELYNTWSFLTPRVACRTTFWAKLTCRHIECGRIKASFLAGNGKPNASGIERIERANQSEGDEGAKLVDDCVRTVLRRLGGLPEVRGNRSVYVDCPFARAWWREHLVSEVSKGNKDIIPDVREVTRINQTYWEELVVLVVSRNSVLGSREIRNRFILSLASLIVRKTNSPLRVAKNLRNACRMVGAIQASKELSVLNYSELQGIMNEVVRVHHKLGNNNTNQ